MVSAVAPFTAATSPTDMVALSSIYTFRNSEHIQQYFATHPLSLSLLQEAPAHIADMFGPAIPVRLEISFDPEYPQQRELWALIAADMQTPEKAEEAERALRRLHEEWLIHLPRAVSGNVHFDLEFA